MLLYSKALISEDPNMIHFFITENILEWLPRQTSPLTFDSRAVFRSMFIGRHNDTIKKQTIVGKIDSNTGTYYEAYNGVQTSGHSDNVFYLVYHKTTGYTIRWIKGIPGLIPSGAVVGGRHANGYPLYVGWSQEPGTYDARKDCLDVEFDGPKCYADYDLLLLTGMVFADKFNFNFIYSQLDNRPDVYRMRIRND